jgi:hypothetical protein
MRVIFAALVTCAVVVASCSGSDSPTSPSGTTGVLNLRLTDSPYGDARSVLVTFSAVTAHRDSEDDFTTLPFAEGTTARTCDLKKLEDAQDVLGVGTLPSGHYTQIRLVVSSATIYFEHAAEGDACAPTVTAPEGRSASLEISSGEVKLNRQFDVPEGGSTTMLLDFDGDRSIRETGNGRYMMTPVIAVQSVQ